MGTVREWTQCSVKSIIALREWTFYEDVETAGILKSFAIETVRIIYDLQFCYFDGTTRIGIISGLCFHKEERNDIRIDACSWRDASRIPKDYILSLRDPLHQGYRGVNINLVELNVDDRKELLLHVSTRTSLCKISQANEFICTNIGTDNSHILIR